MSIRDDFFAKKAKGSLWDVAVSIKRGNPLPLDADSIFESYSALEAYAADVLAYPGQVVAVVEENSTAIYYLDQNLAIKPVGVIPSGDSKTIEVNSEGAISLLGAAGASNGTLPMIENGALVWKTLEDIGAGDGNDNTTYEFSALEKGEEGAKETYGIQIQVKENGIASGDPIVIDFDVYTKSEADAHHKALSDRIGALEEKEDKDTTYSVKEGEKVLKLSGTEFSTEIGLKHENGMISLTGIDGEVIAEFSDADFVKDSVLEDVEYNADSKEIVFTWKTVDGETKTDSVSVADFVQVYTAGNGLALNSNEFSIVIDSESEEFLSVSENGLKVSGIQDAIDAAEGRAAQDATDKAAQALADAKSDAEGKYATKVYVGDIPESYTEETLIDYINKKAEEAIAAARGESTETVASVKNQLDTYIEEHNEVVEQYNTSITEINNKLTTIEENAEVNIIETVKVNGAALTVTDKAVDITVPTALSQLEGYASIDERINSAKSQADKGVEEAGKANAAAAVNAEEIGKHETRIGNLETAKGDHETRIINLENADLQHASEYNTLKSIVDGHTTTIAQKADSTALDAVSAKVSANEAAVKTINETTIPAVNAEIAKKANSADVYTKTEIGTITEGKTLVQMIEDAKTAATYDDTAIKALIAAEESRAKGVEEGLNTRVEKVETFFAAVETPDEVIDTLAEIVKYIEEDRSGAAAMAGNIKANADAIAAINHEETGILAQAKAYTDEQIAGLPVATATALGLVKYDDVTIKMNESNQLYVNKVTTDILENGAEEFVINGGKASN